MTPRQIGLLFMLGVLALREGRARACSHPTTDAGSPPGWDVALAAPQDLETDVPINVVIDLSGTPLVPGDAMNRVYLRGPGPAEVAATIDVDPTTHLSRLIPSAPLAPSSIYQLVDVRDGVETSGGAFTTGASASTDPPPAPTAMFSLTHAVECPYEWCCRSDPTWLVQIVMVTLPPAGTTGADRVMYELRDGATVLASTLERSVQIAVRCSDAYLDGGFGPDFVIGPGTRDMTLVARDRAGHESAAETFTLVGDCAVDPTAPPTGTGRAGDGCAVASTRGRAWMAWVGCAVILLAMARSGGCWRRWGRRTGR